MKIVIHSYIVRISQLALRLERVIIEIYSRRFQPTQFFVHWSRYTLVLRIEGRNHFKFNEIVDIRHLGVCMNSKPPPLLHPELENSGKTHRFGSLLNTFSMSESIFSAAGKKSSCIVAPVNFDVTSLRK